jgi:hypothetical protein
MVVIPSSAPNLAQQLTAIIAVLPGTRGTVRRGKLACTMQLRPSPASRTYTVRLDYRHGQRPRVTVVDPPLEHHPDHDDLPHVYPGDELCLYFPSELKRNTLLARTVVPWIAEWLLHYEAWLVTGQWSGGGHTS